MIPADVASRLRLVAQEQPAPPQPVTPSGKLTDILSDLAPGQRVMAEIQALLPNGTYRAVVAQRDVTLALPFSAKTGDALELEVVESDGKLTLAFVANRTSADQAKKGADSVATTLSQTGRLIGDLFDDGDGQGPRPVPLNGNQPLLEKFSGDAGQLAPLLKQAITQSGMFYEAHQAHWVEGRLATEALLQEPQGKLSSALQAHSSTLPPPDPGRTENNELARMEQPVSRGIAASPPNLADKPQTQGSIPPDLGPLVRQQLDALATQHYLWQGQIWPGQQLHWEIEERGEDRREMAENTEQKWQTRLKLTLPNLGSIDAVMQLRAGNQIEISLAADREESRQRLAAERDTLRQQLDSAGLSLSGMAVQNGEQPR